MRESGAGLVFFASIEQMSFRELRVQRRTPLEVEVGFETDSTFYTGWSGNISEGGLFVATHVVRPIGSRLQLTLTLPVCPEPIRVAGAVRWIREFHENNDVPPGMGIRFEEMPASDLEVVQGFVARRAPLFFDDELS